MIWSTHVLNKPSIQSCARIDWERLTPKSIEGSPHQSQITCVDPDDGICDLAIGDGDGILCGGFLKRWLYLSNETAHSSLDIFANLIRGDAAIVKSLLEGTSRGLIDKNTSCLDT